MTHAISRNLTESNPEFVRGEGIYLFDHDGRRYIDGSSGSSLVCNIGHGVREVAEVMTPQAELLTYNPTHCSNSSAYVDMCAMVSELAPQGLDHIFAVNSGSEATETALKFARQYQVTRKKESKYEIISRWQSYHGNTIGGLSCSGHTFRRRKHAPNLKKYHHIPPAFCYRCHFEKTYPQCELKCARVLENAILQEGPENVSAFIVEAVVGAALGAVPAPEGYFEIIREICDKYDVLLILDEVMTGLGRTGKNFAIDHYNVVPDMIATAKGMGGGYFPVGACIISSKIMSVMEENEVPFEGGHTHSGHLIGCKVANAVLEYLVRNNLIENSREQGAFLLEGLVELKNQLKSIGDVRGKGLMCGVEFVRDKATGEPFPVEYRYTERVMNHCLDRDLIVFPGHGTVDGIAGDHLLLGPPLSITKSQVTDMLSILKQSIIAAEAELPII